MKNLRLMIPGPVEVDPDVLAVMAKPMTPHYGKEWAEFYYETSRLLQKIFQTDGDLFIFPGSGSAGLDAAFAATVFPDGKLLIPKNGFFGERLEEIARTYSSQVHTLEFPVGQQIDLDQLEDTLRRNQFDALALVHCETSIGMLTPVQEAAQLCRKYGVLCIIDAVSSLAIEPLEMDAWGIDLCVSASQKGLESPPGLGLAAVGKNAWKRIEHVKSPGWFLNFKIWKKYEKQWGDWHPQPITHAVNNLKALRKGIDRVLEEGLEARFDRHRACTRQLRQGLQARGFELCVPDNSASHGVTSARDPRNKVAELLAYLREEQGIALAGSLGELKGKVFRVGHMGTGATTEMINMVLTALDQAIIALYPGQ
ncbi:aminotransferase class V [Candidatus Vecturithrix granuli]|uniref:Aminotransferase class V n=1 Tax=Vecturithrix granuli TaxID=1499967 RepID=A0A081C8H4_VECG1|nr:aminotransferase class V [Candidatus Vecturithrix granuli]